MTISNIENAALIETARGFAPRIWALRDEIEQNRRLPASLVQEMAEAGLFRMLVPRSLGGTEVDPLTALRVVEEIAKVDGSTGWSLMIGSTGSLLSARLGEYAARTIHASDPNVVLGGSLWPRGEATVVEGGYRVSGRWPFASGIEHCAWRLGACVVLNADGSARLTADGEPVMRVLYFPAGDTEVVDTWTVGGLRGTGSHDFTVTDAFVPEELSMSLGVHRRIPARSTPSRCLALARPSSLLCPSASRVPLLMHWWRWPA